jgi:hypothetical protein
MSCLTESNPENCLYTGVLNIVEALGKIDQSECKSTGTTVSLTGLFGYAVTLVGKVIMS